MDQFSSKEYQHSRSGYSLFCMLEYFVAIMVSDAYLSRLLQELGFTDAQIGVLSALSAVAFLFGLFTLFTAAKIRHMKRHIIIGNIASEIIFSLLFLIPLLNLPKAVRLPLTVCCILAAYYFRYSVEAMLSCWGNSYVDPGNRGKFSAGKEMMSLAGGTVFTLVLGFVVDIFEDAGNIQGAFLLISVMILVFTAGSYFSLRRISGANAQTIVNRDSAPFGTFLKEILRNRGYMVLVLVHVLSNCSYYLTISFLGTYKLSELALSVGVIQLFNIAGNLSRIFFSKPIGRYSDSHSFAKGISLGLMIFAASYAVNTFTSPKTWYLIIPFTLLSSTGFCGTNQNLENALYSYVPARYYVQASVMKSCIAGLAGFISTLIGSAILSRIQQNGNRIFGISLYGQQFLSFLSLLIALSGILLCRLVLEKQRNLHQ